MGVVRQRWEFVTVGAGPRPSVKRLVAIFVACCGVVTGSACAPAEAPASIDKVRVEKAARRLTLLSAGRPVRAYEIALGSEPVGHKEREGDGRTPEGVYVLDRRNPNSGYHRSIHISYPNEADVARAAKAGVSPGGDIMIHGIRNGLGWIGKWHLATDWTQGCIAVTNDEIEEIWDLVKDGTVVEIVP